MNTFVKPCLSVSHVAPVDDDFIREVNSTKELRETAVYWAELREWSELPWFKRIFTRHPGSSPQL